MSSSLTDSGRNCYCYFDSYRFYMTHDWSNLWPSRCVWCIYYSGLTVLSRSLLLRSLYFWRRTKSPSFTSSAVQKDGNFSLESWGYRKTTVSRDLISPKYSLRIVLGPLVGLGCPSCTFGRPSDSPSPFRRSREEARCARAGPNKGFYQSKMFTRTPRRPSSVVTVSNLLIVKFHKQK